MREFVHTRKASPTVRNKKRESTETLKRAPSVELHYVRANQWVRSNARCTKKDTVETVSFFVVTRAGIEPMTNKFWGKKRVKIRVFKPVFLCQNSALGQNWGRTD